MHPSPAREPSVVRLEGVSVRYGPTHALSEVDLGIDAGRLTVLAGPNGAGKSTLIEVVAGVTPPSTGVVTRTGGTLAFVPQGTVVPPQLPVTVTDVVTMGVWGGTGPWRRVGVTGRRRVESALDLLDLRELRHRSFSELSGGQRQRTLLAQGLARQADLVMLDEPTTGLDDASAATIRTTLTSQVAAGVTVVCVSHDPELLAIADRVVRLQGGRITGG